jgi:hypothetical protein
MLQPGRRLGLALGAGAGGGVVDLDALDRDDAAEALVAGEPDDAEAARPEAAQEAVATEDQTVAAGPLPRPPRGPCAAAAWSRLELLRAVVGGPHRLPRSPPDACRPALTPQLQPGAEPVLPVILAMANRKEPSSVVLRRG